MFNFFVLVLKNDDKVAFETLLKAYKDLNLKKELTIENYTLAVSKAHVYVESILLKGNYFKLLDLQNKLKEFNITTELRFDNWFKSYKFEMLTEDDEIIYLNDKLLNLSKKPYVYNELPIGLTTSPDFNVKFICNGDPEYNDVDYDKEYDDEEKECYDDDIVEYEEEDSEYDDYLMEDVEIDDDEYDDEYDDYYEDEVVLDQAQFNCLIDVLTDINETLNDINYNLDNSDFNDDLN